MDSPLYPTQMNLYMLDRKTYQRQMKKCTHLVFVYLSAVKVYDEKKFIKLETGMKSPASRSYICSTYIALARPATLQMFQSNGQHIHNLYQNPQPSAKQQSSGHLIIELWPPPFCKIYVKLLVQLLCWKKISCFNNLTYMCDRVARDRQFFLMVIEIVLH